MDCDDDTADPADPGVFSAIPLADSAVYDMSWTCAVPTPPPSGIDPTAGPMDQADPRPLRASADITVIDGAAGRRLAQVQAHAIREVLTWWINHNTPEISSTQQEAA